MKGTFSILAVGICAAVAAQIVPSSRGVNTYPMERGQGRIYTNVHQGPDSLHRPWAGSETYRRNIEMGRGSGSSGRSSFQRDRDATLDVYHREEERARRIRRQEQKTAEMEAQVRANKAQIESDRRRAELDRKAREDAQQAELRRRAEEQERRQQLRQSERELSYDRTMRSLGDCQAVMSDGRACPRKANPGQNFCYLHVDWRGDVRNSRGLAETEPSTEARPVPTDQTEATVTKATVEPPFVERVAPAISESAPEKKTSSPDMVPFSTFQIVLLIGGLCLTAILLVGFFVLQAIRIAKKSPFDV